MSDPASHKTLYKIDDIIAFLEQFSGGRIRRLRNEDVFRSLNIDGDDITEFMIAYRDRFNVNIDKFLWYFHGGEEGWSLGGAFIKPPNYRVKIIPISTTLLLDSANAGCWALDYPPHRLPEKRYDLRIDSIVSMALLAGVVALLLLKWSGR